MKESVREAVVMWKNRIGFRRVPHVFLDAEVGHRNVEVQRRAHANGRQIGCPVRAGAHLIKLSERSDFPQMRNAAGVDHGGADVVDELIFDEGAAVVIVLNTSPMAIGVVVWLRIKRNASWFSAGVGSSIQKSRYGSRLLPTRAASMGVRRWWTSCKRWKSKPCLSRIASKSFGMKSMYFSVDQTCSSGWPLVAGS